MEKHPIPPFYTKESKILILGSFPSVKSREMKFYYGHPQNRFWKVISEVFKSEVPKIIKEKKEFLAKHNIALWDVISSCDIKGSSDSSICNVIVNDIFQIVNNSSIEKIFVNGGKAYDLFKKYFDFDKLPTVIKLPSTSPANARWTLEKLIDEWSKLNM